MQLISRKIRVSDPKLFVSDLATDPNPACSKFSGFESGFGYESGTETFFSNPDPKKKAGTHIHDIVEDGEHPLQGEGFRTRQLAVHPLLRFHLHGNAR